MKAPVSWLKDYVDIDISVKELADSMTMTGSKVEEIIEEGKEITNVVVCKIIEIEKHPDADKLVVTKADIGGGKILQIVTGAPNTQLNSFVPVALDGATLPGGHTIKTGKLRGVVSEGMFCSSQELGKTPEDFPGSCEYGLLILNDIGFKPEFLETKKGTDVKELLGINETVIDFEITNNRPDCFSIIGLAREAAVTMGKDFSAPKIKETGKEGNPADYLKVTVEDPELCPRYVARVVKDVKIGPSPKWMRDRLNAAGVRAIDNIVDITNYVMLEYGQPMHAFDYRNIENGHIIVRKANDGETITTLDNEERNLKSTHIVIGDEKKPIAVAGVMGGLYSGINEDTTTIVFESAVFDAATVRLGAKDLAMRTEASTRFEKGLDLNNCVPAIDRACELVEILGAGTVVGGYVDVKAKDNLPVQINFRPERINAFLGTEIPEIKMVSILEMLGMTVKDNMITVPTYRPDVKMEADVAEEIARFYGYNNIQSSLLAGKAATQGRKNKRQSLLDSIKEFLIAEGAYEALTFSFTSPKVFDKMRLSEDDSRRKALVISNPLGEDFSIMRTSMVPSMLQIISTNYSRRVEEGRIFEVAYTYHSDEKPLKNIPEHRETLVIGAFGKSEDFFTIKGMAEEILIGLKIRSYEFVPFEESPVYHPGRCAKLMINGTEAGILGEIHPLTAENFECPERCYVAEILVDKLVENAVTMPSFKELPKYPAVTRDLAVIVNKDVLSGDIEKIIKQRGGNLLESCGLFDVYEGSQMAEGMKSMAYSLVFRAEDRTLNDEDIQKIIDKILHGIRTQLGGELR